MCKVFSVNTTLKISLLLTDASCKLADLPQTLPLCTSTDTLGKSREELLWFPTVPSTFAQLLPLLRLRLHLLLMHRTNALD